MINEINEIKKELKLINESLMLLNKKITSLPAQEDYKNLKGYFDEIIEQIAEFKMALNIIEKKYPDTKISIAEKIMEFYKNNCELKDGLTKEEMGYYKALCDIQVGKYKV